MRGAAISIEQAMDLVFAHGSELRVALPLGLGKPNYLINKVYERAKADPSRILKIYTALSLNPPAGEPGLAQRFMAPFVRRHFGDDYPVLEYSVDAQRNNLPAHIRVHEFYVQAASALRSPTLQADYQSINYTHVAESLLQAGIQTVLQLIAKRGEGAHATYSLSCNADLTADVVELFQREGKPLQVIGVVHPDLPFLGGDALVSADFFAGIVHDCPPSELFALPKLAVSSAEHAIGFHASRLILDGGTLQIGIGSLSDAVVAALVLRHKNNALYRDLVAASPQMHFPFLPLEDQPFQVGLYGLSEMIMDGFMHLHRAGILHRHITDESTGGKTYLQGAFALGSKEFYAWLRQLSGADFDGLAMTRVSRVNDIYDPNETLLRAQRIKARFLNTCMQVTLLGGAASETLQDGRVVSGVGGQYNFVAMAHELRGARSIMMLRSTRREKRQLVSNVIWSHGHLTIPRHLRDVVVTEYGVADLRGRTDAETIKALLMITDASFQDELLECAKSHGKVEKNYHLPESARRNTSAHLEQFIARGQGSGFFLPFPFGSDFTPVEERLAMALGALKDMGTLPKWKMLQRMAVLVKKSWRTDPREYNDCLQRMKLHHVEHFGERWQRRLLIGALSEI